MSVVIASAVRSRKPDRRGAALAVLTGSSPSSRRLFECSSEAVAPLGGACCGRLRSGRPSGSSMVTVLVTVAVHNAQKRPRSNAPGTFRLVAGVGFEPTTSGL
jgi:hypothetical protein